MEVRMADDIYANSNISTALVPISISYKKKTKIKLEKILKRMIDILAGIVGIICLIPITLVVFIANLFEKDKGNIFYCQDRIGKDGKLFRMYKFRSMVINADEKLFEYLDKDENAKMEYTKYKKLKDDPRITKVGKWLRKTSIDEFPQFINVLKGEMSLVGPRPYLPREKDEMKYYYPYIIKEKPGITGFWQVAGRNNLSFEDRLKLDFNYSKWKSLKLDVKLILKTFTRVIKKEGAE